MKMKRAWWLLCPLLVCVALAALMVIKENDMGGFLIKDGGVSLLAATIQSKQRQHDSEHGNRYFCEYLVQKWKRQQSITNLSSPRLPSSLHYHDIDCGKDYGSSRLGNYLMRWYLTRRIAAQANVTLSGSCRSNQVLQWIPQSDLVPGNVSVDGSGILTRKTAWQDTCALCLSNVTKIADICVFPHGVDADDGAVATINMASMVTTLQSDMQGLLQGVLMQQPWLQEELDDVSIHMRIGDVGSIASGRYGLLPFAVYTKYIDKHLLPSSQINFTIGIVTAPFHQHRGRHRPNNPHFNQAVVEAARDFLRSAYPHATVTIRNSDQDTHDIVFARLLGAKTLLLCAPSTYCLVPAMGRKLPRQSIMIQSKLFGSTPKIKGWLADVQDASNNTFQYVQEEIITSTKLQQMSTVEVVEALSSQTPQTSDG